MTCIKFVGDNGIYMDEIDTTAHGPLIFAMAFAVLAVGMILILLINSIGIPREIGLCVGFLYAVGVFSVLCFISKKSSVYHIWIVGESRYIGKTDNSSFDAIAIAEEVANLERILTENKVAVSRVRELLK